ncbi:hypothetical protein [Streptomyces sp. NPDC050564]|uniref:hypothetical protein n=1 Tax=Streptomyces sp. NPDC050564 TaxID=3365631 RepID=UPI0037B46CBF
MAATNSGLTSQSAKPSRQPLASAGALSLASGYVVTAPDTTSTASASRAVENTMTPSSCICARPVAPGTCAFAAGATASPDDSTAYAAVRATSVPLFTPSSPVEPYALRTAYVFPFSLVTESAAELIPPSFGFGSFHGLPLQRTAPVFRSRATTVAVFASVSCRTNSTTSPPGATTGDVSPSDALTAECEAAGDGGGDDLLDHPQRALVREVAEAQHLDHPGHTAQHCVHVDGGGEDAHARIVGQGGARDRRRHAVW